MADFITLDITKVKKGFKKYEQRVKREIVNSKAEISIGALNQVAKVGVEEMKERIARGQSPIQGNGRLPAYKNPDKYPGKRKPKRPVNLKLSGKFLKALRGIGLKIGNEIFVRIGFSDSLNADKEKGHREGANGQPKRPIIPEGDEKFTPRIVTAMKKEYIKAYKKVLRNKGLL